MEHREVLKIVTRTAEGETVFVTRCTSEVVRGAVHVCYMQDGDECLLAADEGGLSMRRAGMLRGDFLPRKRTNLLIGDGALGGEIPVFTEKYGFCHSPFCVELVYMLGVFPNVSTFHLLISVAAEDL